MKRNWGFFAFGVVVLLLALVVGSCKKEAATGPGPGPQVTQINANGTLVPTSRTQAQGTMFVADQNGNAVTGLTSQNVGVLLKWVVGATPDSVTGTSIVQSISQQGKRIAVATTMDYSGSMYVGDIDSVTGKYRRILDMENAVKTFINAMGSGDIAEIIKFGSSVSVVQPFTGDKNLLLRAVDTLSFSRGATALYRSIVQGILDAALQPSATYSQAVIAFTDGGENASFPVTRDSLFRASRVNAIPVYTIGLLDSSDHSDPPGQNSSAERDLVQIADTTGGFYFYVPSAAQLGQIYSRISGQLSNAYSLSITWPSASLPQSGTQVTAVITVNYNNLVSKFQRGYTIP